MSQILQADVPHRYYLSRKACRGILRRAHERGKPLPPQLEQALQVQAGLIARRPILKISPQAFHINQREETIDLGETAGALLATRNMQMQTFVSRPAIRAFAENQRNEVRDLQDRSGALCSSRGGKQQTYIASFSAGAGARAGTIGYGEECAPTLKAMPSGNMMPAVLCLNDQGGGQMDCAEGVSGTLRAQEHGHQPLVYENHGIDARYTGPHPVAPTLSARYGTGGNNVPLVAREDVPVYCITGNAIDRQPQNGGNGIGYQEDIAYTLTSADRHAVCPACQQAADTLCSGDEKGDGDHCVSQDTDLCDPSALHSGLGMAETDDTPPAAYLIRRLTPLECERLQGYPDGWTELPGASDSARYKALGNSVAIPCVEYVLHGIALALKPERVQEKASGGSSV